MNNRGISIVLTSLARTSLFDRLVVGAIALMSVVPAYGAAAAEPAKTAATKTLAMPAAVTATAPEPGPEDGGLRLRLVVEPRAAADKEGFNVRIDLVNVSNQAVTLRTAWEYDATGDVKEYLEAATSIECMPAVEPWRGGLAARQAGETPQQSEHTLKAGETLSAGWKSEARRLKNRVSDPTVVQNPTFPFSGLYSVHANIDVVTSTGTVRLRSNEQLVPVGGSRSMPKHTYGPLWSANAEKKTATIGLGSNHKIQIGDQFEIMSKTESWRIDITEVSSRYSEGKLTLIAAENGAAKAGPELKSVTLVGK